MEAEQHWDLLVREWAIKLAMRDIVVRIGFTPFCTRKGLVIQAIEMVNTDLKWTELATEYLCQKNSKP